jgi:Flp pilus assembly protein TadD
MGLGNVLLARGQPLPALVELRTALSLDPGLAPARINLVHCLSVLGRSAEAVEECRSLVSAMPGDSAATALLARTLGEAGITTDADTAFQSALEMAPADASLWCDYGELLRRTGRSAEAEQALRQALLLDPKHTGALNNLGLLHYGLDDLDKAEACLERAAAAEQVPPQVWANLANVRVSRNRLDDALALFDLSRSAGLSTPEARFDHALALLASGRLQQGFAEYEHRFGTRPYSGMKRDGPGRWWQGESLEGRHLLLWPEQGLGDTLQFVRHTAALAARGARITVEAQQPLVRLLEQSLAAEVVPPGTAVQADFHCPLLSLPHRLGLREPEWRGPYLRAPADAAAARAVAALPRPRVGLVWAGSPAHLNDANRSLPFHALAPLLAVPGVNFCALQFGAAAADAQSRPEGVSWTDLAPLIGDFADTAAALVQLDLLVTVDTSVAHLAGGLGVTAWVLLAFCPDWRWQLERSDTAWYPTLSLFRQPVPRDWTPVVRQAAARLAALHTP